jgi:hypothetical protein
MKKTSLSLIAMMAIGTSLMAGGDIAPVERAVVEAAVAETSGWEFSGQAVAYYQTSDAFGYSDIGSGKSTAGTAGLQLNTENKNIAYGFGAGAQLTGLYRNTDFSDLTMADADGSGDNTTAALTKAYLTYGIANTNIKVGRQELPKALSPFAFSETWNVYRNTFEGAVIANTDIQDTTIVAAYVDGANGFLDMSKFDDLSEDGVYMLTVANKSIDNIALTGSYYYAPDFNAKGDANILWADAIYSSGNIVAGIQGGYIFGDAVDSTETGSFGAKIGMHKDNLSGYIAYSYVDDGSLSVQNLGGTKTPLYTQMISNQAFISTEASTITAKGFVDAWGAKFGIAYGYTMDDSDRDADYQELDLTYSRKVGSNAEVFAGYVYSDIDNSIIDTDGNNMLRVWGKYNF